MTALKPVESLIVRGVAARRYPLNKVCAHPECSETTDDPHHSFPRSMIGNDSWFVILGDDLTETGAGKGSGYRDAIPHVTGLCRAHHDAVELHEAWIKLEDGEWRWYDRVDGIIEGGLSDWRGLGPLNPQPGSRTGKPKKRRFKGEARRQRTTISIRVPKDELEDGAGLLDEAIDTLEQKISGDSHRPPYYTILDGLNYAILNAGEDDFS